MGGNGVKTIECRFIQENALSPKYSRLVDIRVTRSIVWLMLSGS